MNTLSKYIVAGLCGHLWVFLACAFISATIDFTQWNVEMRLMCVMFSPIGAAAGALIFSEGKLQ